MGVDADQVAPRGVDRLSQAFTGFLGRPDLTLPFAVVSLLAAVLFGQALTLTMIIGIALIAVGVLLVEIGSQRALARREQEAR